MKPISIAIVGDIESKQLVVRLSNSITFGRIISDDELSDDDLVECKSTSIRCPYRTRLIPIDLHCFCCDPDTLHWDSNDVFPAIDVWIIVVSPENADINAWYTNNHGQWNSTISKYFASSRRLIACVQPVDHLDDENQLTFTQHNIGSDVKIKNVALYNMSSVHELFEKAINAALDDHFCQIMKSKYSEYCVRNIKHASTLWTAVERLSPWIWALNLFFSSSSLLMLLCFINTLLLSCFRAPFSSSISCC